MKNAFYNSDLFDEDRPQDITSSDSTQEDLDSTITDRYNLNSFKESLTVDQIVFGTKLAEFTRSRPWPVSSGFDDQRPDPTFFDYFQDYLIREKDSVVLNNLKIEEDKVLFPRKEDWVEIGSLYINEEGGQRLQIRDPQESKRLRDHAINFKHGLVSIKVAEIDNKTEFGEMNGRRFVVDGGGTCMKARLRNIKTLPVTVVKVKTFQELCDLFYKSNTETNPVKGVELFKKRLIERDPFARLQDRIMERSNVTPIKYHVDPKLVYCDLGPIKKMLEGTFKGHNTSWSGDPVDMVKDSNLFSNRKAENVTFAIDSHLAAFPGTQIHSSLVVVFCQFKAVWNGTITQSRFVEFLKDIKTHNSEGNPLYPIMLKDIDPSQIKQTANLRNPKTISIALNLTRMQTEKCWGVVALSRCWNIWAKQKGHSSLVLDDVHINGMMSRTGFRPYH